MFNRSHMPNPNRMQFAEAPKNSARKKDTGCELTIAAFGGRGWYGGLSAVRGMTWTSHSSMELMLFKSTHP
jgi:hypothetical protein